MSTPSPKYPIRPQHEEQQQQHYQQKPPPSSASRSPRLPTTKRSPSNNSNSRGGISILSEDPFVIHIPLKGVPMVRASTRTPKRSRPTYQEIADTDSDDFASDSDEVGAANKKKKSAKRNHAKRLSLSKVLPTDGAAAAAAAPGGVLPLSAAAAVENGLQPPTTADNAAADADYDVTMVADLPQQPTSLDAPPPGTLNTLWYSRECFLHVFVMEKPLAWKTRAVTLLEWVTENFPEGFVPPTLHPTIDPAEGRRLQQIALLNSDIWSNQSKRMEISRLLPEQCPTVMVMAAAKEYIDTQGKPKFRIKHHPDPEVQANREEVHLVKWRGRSHIHASWERGSDIIKYDQSNNTARNKLRRYVQSQEIAFGNNWKQVLEEERTTGAAIHAHGADQQQHANQQHVQHQADPDSANPPPSPADAGNDDQLEEYFAPAYTELERIVACDESSMDPKLFAKQRALNIRGEQEQVRQKELPETEVKKWNSQENLEVMLKETPWDPEDNVRYVVKWKGLPFAEMTWEYWRDIKRDAVNEAEDFWIRQQPPDEAVIVATNKPHPHMQDFRKIQESPAYGISTRERPVADLDLGNGENSNNNNSNNMDEEEGDAPPAFKLRSYQLEGVNWLLFNWWNKRSCILADGT
jgi:hypothetical protein